jgi:serpin B
MKKRFLVMLILGTGLSLMLFTSGFSQPAKARSGGFGAVEEELVLSNTRFGLDLLKEIVRDDPDQNAFISPFSISAALAMVYNGAASLTKSEMEQVLRFEGLADGRIDPSFHRLMTHLTELDPDVTTEIANSIWFNNTRRFEQQYLDTNKYYFDAEITGLDFRNPSAADTINDWVREKTHDRIDGIVSPPIPSDMAMYLINAIYFKGVWTHKFDENATQDDYFNLTDGSRQPVRMMQMTRKFRYFEDSTVQAITLPYGQERFAMTILLPRPERDLTAFALELKDSTISRWLQCSLRRGSLHLPRFKIEYERILNDVLQEMGMKRAFSPDSADFSRMSTSDTLYISEVKHKSFVEVNEEGTEAAAATSVGMALTASADVALPPFVMRVDRPFVFLIHEQTSKAILFIGRIMNIGM